ncbi:MAG: glycosyltransferase [Candidatus Bipolaricaulota bacterium]
MRIGLFTDAYLPEITGVTTVVRTLRDELGRMGHEPFVYAPRYGGPSDDEAQVFRFRSGPVFAYRTARMALPYSRDAAKTYALLDVVHSHTPFSLAYVAFAAARRHGLPHVQTYHTYLSHYRHYIPRPLRPSVRSAERYSALLCNHCTLITVPTPSIRDELCKFGVRRPIRVLPFGPDLRDYEGQAVWEPRRALAVDESAPLFLYAGRVAPEKNLLFLLNGFARVREQLEAATLVFAGDGPMRKQLEDAAAQLGISGSVRFAGFLDRPRLVDLYRESDVFLFASKTETQGLVLVEAMAAGTPAVAVRAMGVRDVVEDGWNGFLVPEEEDAFAERAVFLATNPALTQQLAVGARATAERMSLQNGVRGLVEVYEEALASRPRNRAGRMARLRQRALTRR